MGIRERHIATADRLFAANLRTARRARGLRLEDLSIALSDSETPILKTGLSKLETGERAVTLGEAVALCSILGVPLDAMVQDRLQVRVELA